jgi:hypothetical protein
MEFQNHRSPWGVQHLAPLFFKHKGCKKLWVLHKISKTYASSLKPVGLYKVSFD